MFYGPKTFHRDHGFGPESYMNFSCKISTYLYLAVYSNYLLNLDLKGKAIEKLVKVSVTLSGNPGLGSSSYFKRVCKKTL